VIKSIPRQLVCCTFKSDIESLTKPIAEIVEILVTLKVLAKVSILFNKITFQFCLNFTYVLLSITKKAIILKLIHI